MVFSSAFFLFIFLPLTYLVYIISPGLRLKNIVLVLASLFFYAFGEPVYVIMMLVSICLNYLLALLISSTKGRLGVTLSVIFNIGLLVVFKYSGLLISTLNSITGLDLPLPELSLPIGISFYTFQALSYCIDVYRDRSLVQKNLLKVMLYISFFPQLIAGPIVKYHDIDAMLGERRHSLKETSEGIVRFIFGLSKKLVLANTCAQIVDALYETDLNFAPCAWVFGILYCLQIYFDFSGYSDMAIGLGHIFGFTIKENFNYPYISSSIQEFWRRWHISLSTWFREYLYIPLGGNRKGQTRTIINRFVVFLATGIWHGANWTFLVWGVFHGCFLMLETAGIIRIKNKVIAHIYSLLVIICGFVIFRAETLSKGLHIIASMFSGITPQAAEFNRLMIYVTPWNLLVLCVGLLLSAPVSVKITRVTGLRYASAVALYVLCVFCLGVNSYNPFIYFRF